MKDDLHQKHKELKREVRKAENVRKNVRDWSTKEELKDLKKEKLRVKDKLHAQKH